MQNTLGTPVQLRYNAASGKGRIEIRFNTLDECNGLLERLGMVPQDDG